MNYKKKKKKVLSVKKVESSGHRLHYSRKGLLKVLTWSVEVTPNADLGSKKEGILLVTKTLPNLCNDLESLSCFLGEIVEPLIAFVGY